MVSFLALTEQVGASPEVGHKRDVHGKVKFYEPIMLAQLRLSLAQLGHKRVI